MNILVVNWTWYPSGGDWTYVDNLCRLYESNGHTVIPFGMLDPRNRPTPFSKYFVGHIDYREMHRTRTVQHGIKVLSRTIYSFEARRNLQRLLGEVHIDVAHLNNIHHHITPSIIPVLRDAGIPIVWTLHDFSILCPENSFSSNGQVCERCKGGRFYACTTNRCKKGSYLASFAASLENYSHRMLGVFHDIDYFLCPSEFIRRKFIEFGYPEDKFVVTRLCYDASRMSGLPSLEQNGSYMLYVGRIERIKGWETLVRAAEALPDVPLYIIGDGADSEKLRRRLADGPHWVRYLGRKEPAEVLSYMQNSLFTICPSEWYENFPFSVIEGMLLGKPVIGAKIGGIPELVVDGETGYTFLPGDSVDLAKTIRRMLGSPDHSESMGRAARERAHQMTDFANHYMTLSTVFHRLGLQVNP